MSRTRKFTDEELIERVCDDVKVQDALKDLVIARLVHGDRPGQGEHLKSVIDARTAVLSEECVEEEGMNGDGAA